MRTKQLYRKAVGNGDNKMRETVAATKHPPLQTRETENVQCPLGANIRTGGK